MIDRALRAKVMLDEAHALGLDDLIAAGTTSAARVPTLAAFVDAVALSFTPATARTYRPYWRLDPPRVIVGWSDLHRGPRPGCDRRCRPGATCPGWASRAASDTASRATRCHRCSMPQRASPHHIFARPGEHQGVLYVADQDVAGEVARLGFRRC